ncbi:MAG: hypothetical protein ACE5E5_11975 [Phycisphaerae bacterium]
MALKSKPARRLTLAVALTGVVVATHGCAATGRWIMGGWVADYESAEQRVRDTDRELLIYFKASSQRKTDSVEEILDSAAMKTTLRGYVKCKLFRTHEPHRRYVKQYGVQRAPSLILVHADGTYHATSTVFSREDVKAFLAQSDSAGATPDVNPHLPRAASYRWVRRIEAARQEADQTGQPILYVFVRPMTRDWKNLRSLLNRREVFLRTKRMVACRLSSWSKNARKLAESLGIRDWPAIAICRPDGNNDILERPAAYEPICRLADANLKLHDESASPPVSKASAAGQP